MNLFLICVGVKETRLLTLLLLFILTRISMGPDFFIICFNFADDVQIEIQNLINSLPRKEIIKKSLDLNGLIVLVQNISESPNIINYIAPEHLHIQVEERDKIVKNIRKIVRD